jgi:ribonuclease HI
MYKLYNLENDLKLPQTHKIFTDGSNNTKTKRCGYGVFISDNHPNNITCEITTKKTSNIAELLAILKAIEVGIKLPEYNIGDIIEIYTDSNYSIQSILYWSDTWENNGWKTKNKKAVKNQELIQQIRTLYKSNHRIQLQHVRAHQITPDINSKKYPLWYGNMMADKLAKNID